MPVPVFNQSQADEGGLTALEKEELINEALNSEQGRIALASSMANPIRLSLDYQGVARKFFVVDPLPQGALPVYDKDVRSPAIVLSRRGAVPSRILEGQRITVPTFEISTWPQARYAQIKERRFNMIDRAVQEAKSEIQVTEDANAIATLDAASDDAIAGVNPVTVSAGGLTKDALTAAFFEVEKWDLVPTRILMHQFAYSFFRTFARDDFDPVTMREVLMTGLYGHIWTSDIYVSKMVPKNKVYVLADPEFFGVMPIRQDINVIPADIPEKLRLGWVVYEEIGLAAVNPRAVSQITITP